MTREKIEEELKILYAERKQLEDLYNMIDKEFTEAFVYKLKANDCLIKVFSNKLENIIKETAARHQTVTVS